LLLLLLLLFMLLLLLLMLLLLLLLLSLLLLLLLLFVIVVVVVADVVVVVDNVVLCVYVWAGEIDTYALAYAGNMSTHVIMHHSGVLRYTLFGCPLHGHAALVRTVPYGTRHQPQILGSNYVCPQRHMIGTKVHCTCVRVYKGD